MGTNATTENSRGHDASMGATLFFGLIALTFITQGQSDFVNPQETMEPVVFARVAQAEPVALVPTIPAATRFLDPRDMALADAMAGVSALDGPPPAPALDPVPSAGPAKTADFAAPAGRSATYVPHDSVRTATAPQPDRVEPPITRVPHEDMPNTSAATQARVTVPAPATPDLAPVAEVVFASLPSVQPFADTAVRPVAGNLDRQRAAEGAPARVVLTQASELVPLRAGLGDAGPGLDRPRFLPAPDAPLGLDPAPAQPDTWTDPRPSAWSARVTGDRVFLRALPNAAAPVRGQFDRNTPARVIEARGDWLRVELREGSGWMFGAYLAPIN